MSEPPPASAHETQVSRARALLELSRSLQHAGDAPLLILAPMVRQVLQLTPCLLCSPFWWCQSELAFRQLVRRHNIHLCYTPMIPAAWFATATREEREEVWQHTDGEGPLVAQLCGNEPDPVCAAARVLTATGAVSAIDLNFGCPQSCAERGNYGAFLLDRSEWHKVEAMVCGLSRSMCADPNGVPVFCKMRLLPCIQDTIEFARLLEASGAALITVHGRQRHERDHDPPDWQAIAQVKQSVSVPVIANGGVDTLQDAIQCQHLTGGVIQCSDIVRADGVMQLMV